MLFWNRYTSKVLEPEDADLTIIYRTEGFTPARWPTNCEPRQIQFDDIETNHFLPDDRKWIYTIEKLKWLRKRVRYQRNLSQTVIKIEFAKEDVVPFPSEATFLLRAAFKEMSSVTVGFPRQGLSGSIACFIRPLDSFSNKCKRMFAKIYPYHVKAIKELNNTINWIEPYIESDYYPQHHHLRRYHGRADSILVMDLAEGPNGVLTFKELIESEQYSVELARDFITNALSIMDYGDLSKKDKGWKCYNNDKQRNLLEDYILQFLQDKDKEDRRIRLDSENICNKWFGSLSDDISIEDKIRNSLPVAHLVGTYTKICHGDLHSENIMVKSIGEKLVPFFIDFSRTGETHSLKDLVTLESDMIIRGLGSIKSFSDKRTVRSFLETLYFTPDDKECETELATNMNESLQLQKIRAVIKELRNNAISVHKVPPSEYECAALLKTLEVLSYGKLPHDKTVRATTYVTYLMERLRISAAPCRLL